MRDRQLIFADRLKEFHPATWEHIPDLGLYMDQVITYIERQCKTLYQEGERIVTPAMVNNYVKMGLVDRPVDKKYGREQLAQLLMVCTLKQAASAEGMKVLMKAPEGGTVQALYEDFCGQQQEVLGELVSVLPLPSAMHCAIQSAAYSFLCNALLVKEQPDTKEPGRENNKPANGEPAKGKEAAKPKSTKEINEEAVPKQNPEETEA